MIRFGPAGNADSFYEAGHKSSLEIPEYLAALGLNAYEYQCGRGVNVKSDFCQELAVKAREHKIFLSLHAPYFINLGTSDPKVMESSLGHIAKALAAARDMDATRIVVHPGSRGKGSRTGALTRAERLLAKIAEEMMPAFPGISLCLETMGKVNQLGTLDEVISLCKVDKCLMPAIDFGHLHARDLGAIKGRDEFEAVLDRIASSLGAEAVQNLHIHFSAIEFAKGGEIRHRTFAEREYGPDFEPLAAIVARDRLTPVIISESAGAQTEEALAMKEMVQRYRAKEGGEDV